MSRIISSVLQLANFFLKSFTKFDILNPVVGYCQGNLRDCESCLQSHFSHPCSFRDMTFLFFQKLSKNLDLKILKIFEDTYRGVGNSAGTLRGCKSCHWI